jgi:hypothetical protein
MNMKCPNNDDGPNSPPAWQPTLIMHSRSQLHSWLAPSWAVGHLTTRTGVDDARTVAQHCQVLRSGLQARRDSLLVAIAPGSGDSAPATILAAWLYALDTMIEKAGSAQTIQEGFLRQDGRLV